MPVRQQCCRQRFLLRRTVSITARLHPHMPEILAVAILVKTVIGVIEDHGFGVAGKALFFFHHLPKGCRELDQQPPVLCLLGLNACQCALDFLPHAGLGFLPLVAFIHEHQIAPLAEDRSRHRHTLALLVGRQLVNVQHDHRIR